MSTLTSVKIAKIVLLLTVLSTLALIIVSFGKKESQTQLYFKPKDPGSSAPKEDKKTKKVSQLITTLAIDLPGKYAIFIKDLKTGHTYPFNAHEKFAAASLYKLAVLYKAYEAIEKNELAKDQILSSQKFVLDQSLAGEENGQSTVVPDGTPPEIVSISVENALTLMITASDNYSALLLAQKLGWANIEKFIHEKGIADFDLTSPNAPQITASATGQILEQIYLDKAVDPKASQEMKKLLLEQKVNDRIPKYLPQTVKIAHKTGELKNLRHDAGIVFGRKSHYIFVFLSETPAPGIASENIANFARKIYETLEKN